jgi:hypothetical protein
MPRTVRHAAGVDVPNLLVRGYGAREIACGAAILMTDDATPWIWNRVAGDTLDLATVALARAEGRGGEQKKAWALGALLAVTAIDLYCAYGLTAEKGGRRTAWADYRNRSGFPQGVLAARGAVRDFQVPLDIRGPEALRPQRIEGARHPVAPSGEWVVSSSGVR